MDQRLRRALLAFAREEYAVAIIGAQQLHEFVPGERVLAIARRALGQARRGGKHNPLWCHQCEFDARTRENVSEYAAKLLRQRVVAAFLANLGETPQEIGLAATAAVDLQTIPRLGPRQA